MARRIVSLLPAATESLAELGLLRELVGRSHECNYPPQVLRLPALTLPRVDASKPSALIHADVATKVQQALSLYQIDVEQLKRLRPDYIVTQTLCSVCAITPEELKRALHQMVDSQPQLITYEATSFHGVLNDIQRLGDVFGKGSQAQKLVDKIKDEADRTAAKTRTAGQRPNVLCLEWLDPLMVAGHWTPTLVELAGGVPILAKAGKPSVTVDWREVMKAEPDVIIVMPCGFNLTRTGQEAAMLFDIPQFRATKAFKNKQVYVTDGDAYFNRPGPRLLDSLLILAEILHPKLFGLRRLNYGWAQYF